MPPLNQGLLGQPPNFFDLSVDGMPASENTTFCDAYPDASRCTNGLYGYKISLSAQLVPLTIFCFQLLWTLGNGIALGTTWQEKTADFNIAMWLGVVCELIGYGARATSTRNQENLAAFSIQLVFLTIGPAFMAAAIYTSMRRVVSCFERYMTAPAHRIAPAPVRWPGSGVPTLPLRWYTRIFITSDTISLVLQATGAGMEAVEYRLPGHMDKGDYTMLAGLGLQAFTMVAFIVCAAFYVYRFHSFIVAFPPDRPPSMLPERGNNPLEITSEVHFKRRFEATRRTKRYRQFMGGMGTATVCIAARCCWRVAELSKGSRGHLRENETIFIFFETMLIVIAGCSLCFSTPSRNFPLMCQETEGLRLARCLVRFWNAGAGRAGGAGASDRQASSIPGQQPRENQIRSLWRRLMALGRVGNGPERSRRGSSPRNRADNQPQAGPAQATQAAQGQHMNGSAIPPIELQNWSNNSAPNPA